jgi:type IV pilus assembly protein PilW
VVQSPTGFDPAFCSAATQCLVIVMQDAACELRLATSVVDAINPARRDVTPSPALVNTYDTRAKLMNLGQNGTAMRTRYDVVNNVLRGEDLITNLGGNLPNPVASNILIMKVQYGLDLTQPADGAVDCWTSAIAGSACVDPVTGRTDYSDIRTASATELTRIVAVRVGLVVQSDEYAIKDVPNDTTTHLFNCSLDTDADCQGRIQVTLPKYWRYRTYETVVPIRNAEWNTK